MTQGTLPLENRPGLHHKDAGDTERAGAESVTPRSGTQRAAVLRAIQDSPRTDHEISRYLLLPMSSVNARRNELVRDGLVEDSGLRRKGPYGNDNVVWKCV